MTGPHSLENSEAPVTPHRSPRLWLIPLAVAFSVLLVWVGLGWRARAASAQVRSLAVLPLVDLSAQNGAGWLSDGITAGTIEALARIPGLHVAARSSAFALQGGGDLAAIGRQLGVTAVLRGSFQTAGGRLQLAVEMDRAADGYRLWKATFDRPANEPFEVPQFLAAAIGKRIQLNSPAPPATRHRPLPAAYDAYLQGRELFDPSRPQDFDKAVERLEESTRADPEFALAWAWLSIAREYRVAGGKARPNQAMPESRDAAERAVALDNECGEAHLALGIVKLQYDWDWAAAREEFDHAIKISPGWAFALEWLAHWFESQGRMEQAMAEVESAAALDPLSAVLQGDVAAGLVAMNQADRALPFARKAVELAPGDVGLQAALAQTLLFAGQKEEAQKMADAGNLPAPVRASLAAQLGDRGPARQLLDEAEDLPDEELLLDVVYVQLAAAIKDWDRFFPWLEEAHGERDLQLPYLRMSPLMPKSDPRFVEFLTRMNLPASAR